MSAPTSPFSTVKRVVGMIDLAGYARLFRSHEELAIAQLLDAYYRLCHELIGAAGGRVIKFIGDSCLAVFPEQAAGDAVACFRALRARTRALTAERGMPLDTGANMHLAVVLEGMFGPSGSQHEDVLGSGVNQVFLMGRGPGFRISEPVYRALPSDQRSVWDKHKPPAVYTER